MSTPRVCIDRILPKELMRFQATAQINGRASAIAVIGKTWINGSTLRVRLVGGTDAQRATAKAQAELWSSICNIKFDFNNALDAELRITFDANLGAWSYIGTDCRHIPVDQPTMNLGFMDGGTVLHEFGHAIGLAHEHSNPDGGIQWNEAVVFAEMAGSPNFWSKEMTRHNVLRKYSTDQINGTLFDPDSIMLYWFPASWTLNGISTKANEVLSALDKSFAAGARMYPKPVIAAPSIGTELTAGTKASEATIGKFGEEDIFRFTAQSDGRYVIETSGKTDVVMKLFGPGSMTALIAEDDDSGSGLNARILVSLIAGEYFVQVRHYNRRSGMGKYFIGVNKI